METVIRSIVDAVSKGRRASLVTPLETEGSLPTGRDARMAVFEDGTTVGTVGGGRMEADLEQVGRDVLGSGGPRLTHVTLTAEDAREDGLLCGGEATFLVEPVAGEQEVGPLREILRLRQLGRSGIEAIRLIQGEPVHRLVVWREPASPDRTGASMSRRSAGTLGQEELDRAVLVRSDEFEAEEGRQMVELEAEGESVRVLVHPILPIPTAFVFGAGHVGLAVCQIAPAAGFRVVVVDDRPEFANRRRFPNAESVLVREFESVVDTLPVDEASYLVVMTRGHSYDRVVVSQALRTPAAYIGMIGSRRKVAHTLDALRAEGHSREALDRIHAPIGLDIGGDTPGEIAISVVGEMIKVRRHRDAPPPVTPRDVTPWDMILSGRAR